jgi:hypothetical protein
MAHLYNTGPGDLLTADDDVTLLTDDVPTPPTGGGFPVTLLLRLRLHAAWLLFMLMPT